MTAPDYEIVERRQLPVPVRVLAVVDEDDGEIAVAYGHSGYWHMDLRAAALTAAGLAPDALLHGFWVATEAEARNWLTFIARLAVGRAS